MYVTKHEGTVHVLKKLVPPSVCVYSQVCVHAHTAQYLLVYTHMYFIVLKCCTCTSLYIQLMALTKFSTYLIHVPLVAAAVGVGAYHAAQIARRGRVEISHSSTFHTFDALPR